MPSTKKCKPCDQHRGQRVRAKRCTICMDTVLAAHPTDDISDNALSCCNEHQICVGCVRRLVKPTKLCSPVCGGFSYTCPMCRTESCLRPSHVLTLLGTPGPLGTPGERPRIFPVILTV